MTLQLVAFPWRHLSFPGGKELMIKAAEMGVDAIGRFRTLNSPWILGWIIELCLWSGPKVWFVGWCPHGWNRRSSFTWFGNNGDVGTWNGSQGKWWLRTPQRWDHIMMPMFTSWRLLKMADINFVSNPLINMYLGGRFDTYPKRRGLTRVKELDAEVLTWPLVKTTLRILGTQWVTVTWWMFCTWDRMQRRLWVTEIMVVPLYYQEWCAYDASAGQLWHWTPVSQRTADFQPRTGTMLWTNVLNCCIPPLTEMSWWNQASWGDGYITRINSRTRFDHFRLDLVFKTTRECVVLSLWAMVVGVTSPDSPG